MLHGRFTTTGNLTKIFTVTIHTVGCVSIPDQETHVVILCWGYVTSSTMTAPIKSTTYHVLSVDENLTGALQTGFNPGRLSIICVG